MMKFDFEIISEIENIEIIAIESHIHNINYLRKVYGQGRWRKLKGITTVRLLNAEIRRVELHWYEAHGYGKKDVKIKRYID